MVTFKSMPYSPLYIIIYSPEKLQWIANSPHGFNRTFKPTGTNLLINWTGIASIGEWLYNNNCLRLMYYAFAADIPDGPMGGWAGGQRCSATYSRRCWLSHCMEGGLSLYSVQEHCKLNTFLSYL